MSQTHIMEMFEGEISSGASEVWILVQSRVSGAPRCKERERERSALLFCVLSD